MRRPEIRETDQLPVGETPLARTRLRHKRKTAAKIPPHRRADNELVLGRVKNKQELFYRPFQGM
jgi:hypothetical protein